MQERPVHVRDEREERGVAGRELLAELPHPLVRDAAVEHSQAAATRQPEQCGRDGHSDRQPEQEPDRAAADDRLSRGQVTGLAELDALGVVLDDESRVLELERVLPRQVAQRRQRALRDLLRLVGDGDQVSDGLTIAITCLGRIVRKG